MVNWNRDVYPIVVEQLKILNDQGIVPTLRGMYYRLLSLGVFDRGPKYADQALSNHTAKWRRNSIPQLRERHTAYEDTDILTGERVTYTKIRSRRRLKRPLKLPIDCFADDTRGVIRTWSNYKAPDKQIGDIIESLRSFPENFRGNIPRWYGQQHYAEIWVEKKAMIGTLQNIIGDRQVRIVPFSGYSSVPFMHDNMTRLEDNVVMRGSGLVHIIYAGDLDPSGVDIKNNILSSLADYELEDDVDFRHIGVMEQQVEDWKLPYNPTPEKETKLERDPRAKKFKKSHGGKLFQYEIDSLPTLRPDEFKSLILDPIDNEWFDKRLHDEVINNKIHSEKELTKLRKKEIAKLYNEIVKKKRRG